jgi:hypothetical protein
LADARLACLHIAIVQAAVGGKTGVPLRTEMQAVQKWLRHFKVQPAQLAASLRQAFAKGITLQ